MVTGDHGMSDAGGHGGSSPSEITTSTFLMASNIKYALCYGNFYMNAFKAKQHELHLFCILVKLLCLKELYMILNYLQ